MAKTKVAPTVYYFTSFIRVPITESVINNNLHRRNGDLSHGFICLISFQFSTLRKKGRCILKLDFEYLAVNFSALAKAG